MLIISVMIFGTLGVFRKFMPLSSGTLTFWRGIIGGICLILIILIKSKHKYNMKKFLDLKLRTFLILLVTGLMLALHWLFSFEGFKYAPVSIVSPCCYMQPIFVIILSSIFFHEKITRRKIFCFIAALIGMILISGIIESGLPEQGILSGVIYGLLSGFFYALVVIFNKLVPGVDAYIKTIIQIVTASLAMLPYIFLTQSYLNDSWSFSAVILMIIFGIVNTAIAFGLYFASMDGLKAHTIAIFGYLDPVTALILAALILGESLSIYGIIGVILILGAALICELDFN